MQTMSCLLLRSRVLRTITFPTVRRSISSAIVDEHAAFLTDIAKITPPKQLEALLEALQLKGEELVSPWKRNGLNPILVPLSFAPSDRSYTCFLRWPTQKVDMELQLVKTTEAGVKLLALSVNQFCHRELVEADFYKRQYVRQLLDIVSVNSSSDKGIRIYEPGAFEPFMKAGKAPATTDRERRLALDRFILTKVGSFPDCFEHLAEAFVDQSNEMSALVTCERSASVFYGWAHPMGFHARLLSKLNRAAEAHDVARSAMQMPKWTLAESNEELETVLKLAGYTKKKVVGDMHAFRSTDPRTKDMEENGCTKEQIALDQAAHLMDAVALGSVEGGWDAIREPLAQRYRTGGYPEMAAFIEATHS